MLLILIPIAWLTVIVLLVAVCRVAAGGETLRAAVDADAPIGPRLVLHREPETTHAWRSHRALHPSPAALVGARRRIAAHHR